MTKSLLYVEGKCLAKDKSSQDKHDQIKAEDEDGDGDDEKMIHGKGQSRGAPRNQVLRQDEEDDAQSIDRVAQEDQKQIPELLFQGSGIE